MRNQMCMLCCAGTCLLPAQHQAVSLHVACTWAEILRSACCRVLLALGSVDNSIWLLLRPPNGTFARVCRLKGHADWIRSLAFTHPAGD